MSRPFRRSTQLAVHIPTPNTTIFFCGDWRKSRKSSLTHHQMHWTRWCWLKLALILIPEDLLLTLLHQKCPSLPTASFTPLPPSCLSDLQDLVLSFCLSKEHQICWDISKCRIVMGKHLIVKTKGSLWPPKIPHFFPLMWRKVAKQQLVHAETPKQKAITRRKLQCSDFGTSLPSWWCLCGSGDSTPPRKQEGNKTYNAEGQGITYFKARRWSWIISSQLFHLVSLQSADLQSITSAQDP